MAALFKLGKACVREESHHGDRFCGSFGGDGALWFTSTTTATTTIACSVYVGKNVVHNERS